MKATVAVVSDPLFNELKAYVIDKTGLVYFRDKDADLAQRLSRRFLACGDTTCAAYLARLHDDGHGPEFDALVNELTIGETYFFRHREQFDALRERVVPDLIARNQSSRKLRIWCAGCSIGPEPYSIAILLRDHFGLELNGWDVKVIGTDLNRDFLKRAREARFEEWAFRTTEPDLRRRHFTDEGKSWVVNADVRALVEFHQHNLLAPFGPPSGGGAFDLIFCRNVMIYFDWPTVATIIPKFEQNLTEGGWLVIGHAEQAHGATALRTVALPGVTFYQKHAPPFVLAAAPADIRPMVEVKPPVPLALGAAAHAELKSLADRGLFAEALALSGRQIAQDPGDARPYFYRALVNAQLRRAAEAGPDLERAIQLDQTFVMAHYLLGLHLKNGNDQRGAARSFHRALYLLDQLPNGATLPESDQLTVAELKSIIASYLEAA